MPALPEVSQSWTADVGEYASALTEGISIADRFAAANHDAVASVVELQAVIDALHGTDVKIGVDVAGTAATAAAAANTVLAHSSDDAAMAMTREVGAANEAIRAGLAAAAAEEAAAVASQNAASAYGEEAVRAAELAAVQDVLAASSEDSARSSYTTGTAVKALSAAAGGGLAGLTLFGLTMTQLHWAIAGTAEAASVLIPAAIAMGAGMMVAAQGAMNMERHMVALYDATEATSAVYGKTVGDVLGLGHALQTAQNAANPGVYELLGSVLNDMKGRMGTFATAGLQVVHMWDEFAARVTVDLKGSLGTTVHDLLSRMVIDLQMVGQILGNTGHAVLDFADKMPGLAQLLFRVVDGISRLILWVSQLPAWLVTGGMAMEEFARWGGLLATTLLRIVGAGTELGAIGAGNFFTRFGAGLSLLVTLGGRALIWAGQMVGRLAGLLPAAEGAGSALARMGSKVALMAESLSPGLIAGIAVAAAGLGYLIYRLVTAKDATEKWAAASQKAAASASAMQVLPTIYNELAQNSIRLSQAQQTVAHTGQYMSDVNLHTGMVMGRSVSPAYQQAAHNVQVLNANQRALIGTAATVGQNIEFLSQKFHVGAAAAVMLAQEAGVKLQGALYKGGEGAKIAVQQIDNLLAGMGAMRAPAGALGNDMQVLGVQSSLAATKVQQLTQAWQAYLGLVTGGASAFSQFMVSLRTMQHDAAATSASLSGSFSSIKTGATTMQYTLHGLGSAAMQSMQQFTQALSGPATQMLTWIQTANAAGVGLGKLAPAVKDITALLAPMTKGNKMAVEMLSAFAQAAGVHATGSLRHLESQLGNTHNAARNLDKIIATITGGMSHLNKVAQNLSSVVGQQLDQSFAQAAIKASHLDQAYKTYTKAIASGHASRATLQRDLQHIQQDTATLQRIQRAGTGVMNMYTHSISNSAAQMRIATAEARQFIAEINRMHSRTIDVSTVFTTVGRPAPGLGGRTFIRAQHGGVLPGFQPGADIVPAMLSPGESVLNPYATRMLGPGMVNWLNAAAERGSVNPAALRTGGSGMGGFGGEPAVVQAHLYLDSKEIFHSVRQESYRWTTRNSGVRTGLLVPGYSTKGA